LALPIVILPVTVTVPVDNVTPEILLLLPAAVTVIELQERLPVPTANILLSPLPVPAPIETPLVTVKLFVPLIDTVFAVPPPFIVKLLQTAAVFTVIVEVMPLGITTLCAAVGTKFKDQFAAVFQLLLDEPSQVLVCPNACVKEPTVNSKKSIAIFIGDLIFREYKFLFIGLRVLKDKYLPMINISRRFGNTFQLKNTFAFRNGILKLHKGYFEGQRA
jgi:hypothetical protein